MQRKVLRWLGLLFAFGSAGIAHAHVKWFVETEAIVAQETTFFRLDDPFVLTWLAIIVLVLLVAFLLDLLVPEPSKKILKKIESWKPAVFRVFEVVIGVNLLIEAYLGAVIAPPFVADTHFTFLLLGLQIFVGFLLVVGLNVQQAAAALLVLYFGAMVQFGVLPLLDEVFMIGVVAYLFLGHDRPKDWLHQYQEYALPLLRVFTGVSLMILAFTEKFLHPELGLNFLQEHPWNFMQMIGIKEFTDLMFVFSAGSMEFLFGAIMVLGLIPRINMAVTAVFFTITIILLGPIEVIGHLPIFVTAMVIVLYGGGERLLFRNLLPHKKRSWFAALFERK